ncbi:hypothetical protein P9G40_19365 [Bacillus velezensis]|uniref:hypothetical protein n=1 Tax=Bacillus velezensis TaxID=492670 RepID=UPI002DBDD2E4|nr:hypothetical protein [Bacillus velezensis]MEC2153259.1 hypothetical protein [Bacillus velezensis]MEC2157302.1 hypothetical protein [Bacillus velezensis]
MSAARKWRDLRSKLIGYKVYGKFSDVVIDHILNDMDKLDVRHDKDKNKNKEKGVVEWELLNSYTLSAVTL